MPGAPAHNPPPNASIDPVDGTWALHSPGCSGWSPAPFTPWADPPPPAPNPSSSVSAGANTPFSRSTAMRSKPPSAPWSRRLADAAITWSPPPTPCSTTLRHSMLRWNAKDSTC